MSGYILDASIALSWCFADESTPVTIKLLERLEKEIAHVPSIWSLELGNVLIQAEKAKRISYAKITEFISLLENINIKIDSETSARSFHEILSLAHHEKLTTYDAAYLELAMRLGLPLATKDTHLRKVGEKLGLRILTT